jgi:hypothetical protein
MSPWVAYALGLVTLPVLAAIWSFVRWATRPGYGQEGCYVCDHAPVAKIGEHRMITMRIWSLWHDYFWSYRKWHRDAWAAHEWNPRNRPDRVPTTAIFPEKRSR